MTQVTPHKSCFSKELTYDTFVIKIFTAVTLADINSKKLKAAVIIFQILFNIISNSNNIPTVESADVLCHSLI